MCMRVCRRLGSNSAWCGGSQVRRMWSSPDYLLRSGASLSHLRDRDKDPREAAGLSEKLPGGNTFSYEAE